MTRPTHPIQEDELILFLCIQHSPPCPTWLGNHVTSGRLPPCAASPTAHPCLQRPPADHQHSSPMHWPRPSGHMPCVPRLGFSSPLQVWGRRGECQRRGEDNIQPARRTHLPEPLDLLAVLGVVPVDGVLLPVVHVYLLHAAQHQLRGRASGRQGAARPPAPRPLTRSPADEPPTLPAISAGSFNHMDDTDLGHRPREGWV